MVMACWCACKICASFFLFLEGNSVCVPTNFVVFLYIYFFAFGLYEPMARLLKCVLVHQKTEVFYSSDCVPDANLCYH
jgi:hypothetical protein